ncbi:CsgG/HfaB family protein [Sphingomonas fennica]|uniref:Uncharacterized protein n=1 Tax=Edaphosphingomonas fennica TaxID=114404 RepID=A0A2T4I882_9SPHN|nr:CsgG/HfaB family protein [Sphingomonas fennica]PTD27833.1 hypothetical protein CV103_00870 [Sphingomonas fennica]
MRAGAIGRQLAGKSNWRRLAGASLAVLALPGCVAMQQQRLAPGEAPVLQGPAVRDNRTPMDAPLACLASQIRAGGRKPFVIAVGDVRDYTGKYSINEGNAITQGGALMVSSALGKLGSAVRLAERFDPTIAERELGYTDRRQLGDGSAHDIPGPEGPRNVPWLPYFGGSITASDYFIVGGVTELNYDIRSGGAEVAVGNVGPKVRTYTQSVAIDLRIVDTRSLLVVRTISLAKQFTGYETGFGVFRFFGSDLFDINVGAKGQEPLQLGIRTALEEATLRLVSTVARVDPSTCMKQVSWEPAPAAASDKAPLAPASLSASRGQPAFNGPKAGADTQAGASIQLAFEVGSADLTGSASALLERIAAGAAYGPIMVTLVARDSENLDPGARDALTGRRIEALMTALAQRGVARRAIETVWRPGKGDPAIIPATPGLQRLAVVRISR